MKYLNFFKQVKQEFAKITWPTRSELLSSVMIIAATVFVFSFVVLGVDYVFHKIINFLLFF